MNKDVVSPVALDPSLNGDRDFHALANRRGAAPVRTVTHEAA